MDIIKNISIIFISIFFESLPFLLLGSLISSIIETYISNETMAKIIPKNKILGSIVGIFLGFFLPACDCAVIPVSKRLIKKKVPINVAISFMLASPIINPVVLLSTYNAFYKTNPEIFWYRLLFGIIIALVIGIIIGIIFNKKEVIINNKDDKDECMCSHKHKEKIVEETNIEEETESYDFSNPYFEVVDENYNGLASYLTFAPKADKFKNKTIRVKGLALKEAKYLPEGFFILGKYVISCCVADAEFSGFVVKNDDNKIKENTWYEIEGILEKGKDSENFDIMYIKIINAKEININDEEQYVYPCYSYDNGACEALSKYELEY